ncbi:hypothetical protein K402DRAFT_426021 [Aulographum hederae CBS 113979]|uniref:CCHC-type domain-containing protein n=1 Tax=Aulographum hederae CBS 113979 TaxID=1176131 RepID=A0A6G1GIK6_9PEZI|nr:hypothetical protein K402DRAFT_426021 [Aulographum hederae CBS 113979]
MVHEREEAASAQPANIATQTTIQNSFGDVDSSDSEGGRDNVEMSENKKVASRRARFGLLDRSTDDLARNESKSPRKKDNDKRRRFTFNREEKEVVLLQHTEEAGEETTIRQAHFANAAEFRAAIDRGDIDGVFEALIVCIRELELSDSQNEKLHEQVRGLEIQVEEMDESLAYLNVTSQYNDEKNAKLSQEVAHLRKWKTTYRNEKKEALQKVKELETELAREKERVEEEDRDSSDDEAQLSRHRRPRERERRTTTPLSLVSRPEKSNNKWPDIKEFFGDSEKQRNEYPQWRSSVHSKFRNSWDMFSTDQAKIDYVRDKCKSTAFNVIETRADLEGPNPYESFAEMLKDLDDMFAEHDPMGKADALLHSTDFSMKKGERFEAFLARFTKVAAVLQLTELGKISNCKRLLSGRLKNKINDGTYYSSYTELVRRCKQCDVDLNILWGNEEKDKNTPANGGSGGAAGAGRGRGGRGTGGSPRSGSARPSTTSRAPHVTTRLKTVGACYKCGEKGHMSFQRDAPCKGTQYLTDEAILVKLHATDVAELPAHPPQAENE